MSTTNLVTFDHRKDTYLYYNDFYYGGEKVKSPSSQQLGTTVINRKAWNSELKEYFYTSRSIRSYLTPYDGEDENKFLERARGAYYFNLVAQVVNAYSDSVTSKVSRNLGLLEPFVNDNVDYRDSTWSEFINQNAKMTALYGMTATYVDYSVSEDKQVNSRFDLYGNGPKTILITPLSFAWMRISPHGELKELAYFENFVMDFGYTANVVLRIINEEGVKQIGIIGYDTNKNIYEQVTANGSLISEYKHPASLNGKLPVVLNFYERDYNTAYPFGKSLIGDLVDTARAVYNYSSWASDIHQRSSFPILTIPLARTGGVMPPKTEVAVGSTNALPYDSESGTPSFISPAADPTRELREHIIFMIQRAYQQVGLALNVDMNSQVQSGEALKIRSREFESYASNFASFMHKYELKVLELFKLYLNMPEVQPVITYPKTFSIPQTTEDITNAEAVLNVPFISDEGKIAALQQIVSVALSVSDEQLNTIIETSQQKLDALNAAQVASIASP